MPNPIEILEDFIIQTKMGLYCTYGNFYLDPKEPFVDAVISHAHGDHAIALFCALQLMQKRGSLAGACAAQGMPQSNCSTWTQK